MINSTRSFATQAKSAPPSDSMTTAYRLATRALDPTAVSAAHVAPNSRAIHAVPSERGSRVTAETGGRACGSGRGSGRARASVTAAATRASPQSTPPKRPVGKARATSRIAAPAIATIKAGTIAMAFGTISGPTLGRQGRTSQGQTQSGRNRLRPETQRDQAHQERPEDE